MSERPLHERLCPVIAISYDEYSHALNSGQYHYSERETNFQRLKGAQMHLDIVKRGTEDCDGPAVIEDEGVMKLKCPRKGMSWTREELQELYEGYEGERPSLFFAVQMLEESIPVSGE